MARCTLRRALLGLLLIGLALVGADEAPAKDAVPADEAPAADAAPAEAAPAEAAAAAVSTGSIMDKVKNTKAPKVVGGGYRPESAYTSTASYGAPHFLIMCIMLVFLAAGCKEAYDRYGNKDAYKKKKKKHDTIGGYGAVNKEDESDEEAPSLMGDLKGLVGGGAGKLGSGVGGVTGGMSKGVGIFTAVAKNMTSDLQKAGLAAADKAKSGVSDAVNVSAHLEKAKAAASVVGNVASAAAEDAKKGAEAGLSKGLDTARSAADVSAHLEKAKAAASVVGNVASAAAEDAKKGAEAGISKGLDTARSASDVSAHLEKAKAAATLATNVASSAVNDAAKASQEAASAGLNAAKDGVGKVGSVAGDGAALLSARSEISEGKAENTMKFDKSAGKWKGNEEVLTAFGPSSSNSNSNVVATEMLPQSNTVPSPAAAKGETAFVMSDAEKATLAQAAATTEAHMASWNRDGDAPWKCDDPSKGSDSSTENKLDGPASSL